MTPKGKQIQIVHTPINYSSAGGQLEEHLAGIDTALGGKASTTHASAHVLGGSDEVDGDEIDIDFTPSNYTPATGTPGTNVDHLAAHLRGIDAALLGVGGGGYETIEYVGGDTTTTTTGSDVALDVPAGVGTGDLMIACLVHENDTGNTWTPPSGWTLRVDEQATGGTPGSPPTLSIWYRFASGEEPASYTWSASVANGLIGALVAYRGVDSSTPFDASDVAATGASGEVDPGSITTVTDGAFVVAVGFADDDTSWSALSSGYNSRATAYDAGNGNGSRLGICDLEVASAGATNPGEYTSGDSEEWGAITLALRPSAAYTGTVRGPASATDNHVPRWDGSSGEVLQDSGVEIDDSDNMSGVADLRSLRYIMGSGPDLSLMPVVGGQSVAVAWWGIQLRGHHRASVSDHSPADVGNEDDWCVVVPTGTTNPTRATLGIVGEDGMTNDLQQWTDYLLNTLSAVDANGNWNEYGQRETRFWDSDSSNYVALRAAATVGANVTWTLPDSDGSSGQLLSTNGTGTLGWASAATLTSTAPVNVTKSAAVVGVGTTAARHDHKHDITTAAAVAASVGQSNAEGTATSLARSDHTHAHSAGTPVNVTKAANAAGSATTFSRSDHKHDVSTATPSTIGTANSEGSSTSLARADHVHSIGTHASRHVLGGADEIDGDEVDIDFTPTNYTPSTGTPGSNVDHLAAHLRGIDTALGSAGGNTAAGETFQFALCDYAGINVEQNDRVYATAFIPLHDMTITSMRCCVTQTASGNVYAAIYNSSLNKVVDESTGASCSTNGFKTLTLASTALTKGTLYYLCFRCDANGSLFLGHTCATTDFGSTLAPAFLDESAAASSFPSSIVIDNRPGYAMWARVD